jgi:hypothetical protein
MTRDRSRWGFRISTLMLLVVILALSVTLVIEGRRGAQAQMIADKLAAEQMNLMTYIKKTEMALAATKQALAMCNQAKARLETRFPSQSPAGESPSRTTEPLPDKMPRGIKSLGPLQ